MQNQVIIYPTDDGGVAVIVPAENSGMTLEEVANKDVPSGKLYEIVDKSSLPADREFRNAWEYDPPLGPKGE